MITINGQKMGKSLGNFITLEEFFTGNHKLLDRAYSPMTIRFFILQAHYRSTVDFSNEALQAAEKGYRRLMDGLKTMGKIKPGNESSFSVEEWKKKCFDAMNDDLNSPVLIAHLFEGVRQINNMAAEKSALTEKDLAEFKSAMELFSYEILGLIDEDNTNAGGDDSHLKEVVDLLLNIRLEAKANKDWATADKIRNELQKLGFVIKDTKDGFEWEMK
jgi:cysteinyl-tRNA synthetase